MHDAAGVVPYLADLGVTHLYCSPWLQAAPGSTHGYDVVDHGTVSAELGGADGLARLTAAAHDHGLGLVLDIVPNHMAIGGRANAWWWDVLARGPESQWASHFDIDWTGGTVLVPILGDALERELAKGTIQLGTGEDGDPVIRYFDHELPVAEGTADGDDVDLDGVLRRQHYRLAHWRAADREIDYRRFFSIATLAGLRAEDPEVFDATHSLVLSQVADGTVDGLRVDHVDGLRDPEGYLRRLRDAVGDTSIVVEKILATDEALPESWPVEGTTGYEFAAAVGGLFVDATAEGPLTELYAAFTGESRSYDEIEREAKREIMDGELAAEVDRVTRLLAGVVAPVDDAVLRDALCEVVAHLDVYRTYVHPERDASSTDRERVAAAVVGARAQRPDLPAELLGVIEQVLLLDHRDPAAAEVALRAQQLTAPVMAKGAEDTALYRYHRLVALNEVGAHPGTFGLAPEAYHERLARSAARWPRTMLTLSTHDTKRSADVRARISLLSERPDVWRAAVTRWREGNERHRRDGAPDRNDEYLLYQTLLGAWPIDADRLAAYMQKAAREAKRHTSWADPDESYEAALDAFARGVVGDPAFVADLEAFLTAERIVARGVASSVAQAALLVTGPGVADVYQGSELVDLSLVDPDNRRPVDYDERRRGLASGRRPKQALLQRLLQHRRAHPDAYLSTTYEPLPVTGPSARHVVAATRGDVVVVAVRFLAGVGDGWGETSVSLPAGTWHHVLDDGGGGVDGGAVAVGALLGSRATAVLSR